MKRRAQLAILLALAASPLIAAGAAGPVTVTEQQVKIPTYLIGPPDPNPQFYFGGASQGAQQRVYPYPSYDNLTTEKVDKPYKMVYLENEYIKVGILPESGGKIFEAIDKTNGYNFFYHQHVIRPALISLLGAWISGGVEWDLPHHHRATSFIPVQYTTEESPDGSKTVWVGELELRDRMRWAVGITLHPGKSYLEASFRIINRTPLPVSMLCFSNVAVHVNDDYQVIFPPSTQWGTGHGKRDFTSWPIDSNGTDLSWYKNIPGSRSVFAWNYSDDFMAGYDHGKHAGTMAIADHNVVPGKKFFTWGAGPQGRQKDTVLTDADGPYIELMVGAYSDNQPDYSWLAPYETRAWSQFWYPFRDLEGVKKANIEAAVDLTISNGRARAAFFSTSDRPAATASLKLKNQTLLEEKIAINPGKPYVKEIALPAGADEHDLRAVLSDGGTELVTYSPVKLTPEPRPTPVAAFPAPAQVQSVEELYLAGLRMDQFRAPNASPESYWTEALRRDPGDIRSNTMLGIEALRGGRYADAEKYLRTAAQRASDRFTTPKDSEPLYYFGLALKAQGKTDEAFIQFSKSTWSGAWRSQAYFEMAQIASIREEFNAALDYSEKSLAANADNTRALALKATLLRRAGRKQDAIAAANRILAIDPLDPRALMELGYLTGPIKENDAKAPGRLLIENMHAFPALTLELCAEYANAGLWKEGLDIVRLSRELPTTSALAHYYMGYFAQKTDDPHAAEYFANASRATPDYAFPFQMEIIPILEAAMAANPKDSRAPYYLGNLLYDSQPQRAIALWQKSADLGADFPIVYRNLALSYTRLGQADQREKALAWLQKAASLGGNAMIFADLDRLHEENGVDPAKRLALMESHQSVINRDETIAREINLQLVAGKPAAAIELLNARFFRAWEGARGYSLGDSWINANLALGRQHMAAKQYKEALADFQAALQNPPNLQEAGGNTTARRGEIQYFVGLAYEALGDTDKAKAAWTETAATTPADGTGRAGRGGRGGGGGAGALPPGQFSGRGGLGGIASGTRIPDATLYYQALALQKLGQPDRAKTLFQQLLDTGTQASSQNPFPANTSTIPSATRTAIADAHYLTALGNLGLGSKDKAREELATALKISPDHLAAKVTMSEIAP